MFPLFHQRFYAVRINILNNFFLIIVVNFVLKQERITLSCFKCFA